MAQAQPLVRPLQKPRDVSKDDGTEVALAHAQVGHLRSDKGLLMNDNRDMQRLEHKQATQL